jgi:hypothetical protein
MTTLRYYFLNKKKIVLVVFNKYTIDIKGVVINNKTGIIVTTFKSGVYNVSVICDDEGTWHTIRISRALASTFIGPPPSIGHTADHEDNNTNNDTLYNIRWLDRQGQSYNRTMPDTLKSAFIIVKGDISRTSKEWVEHLKNEKNSFGREYTTKMISAYAQKKQYGFSYKIYNDLPGETWKQIRNSENKMGRWEISDMNRVKYVTKFAENVLWGERLDLLTDYPVIKINGKIIMCHILAFVTFFPDDYIAKKPDERILHEDDERSDFRPFKLRIGNQSDNMIDSHINGKHDGKSTMRIKCASYVNGVFEKEHPGQRDAVRYLKSIGFEKAQSTKISKALILFTDGKTSVRYGRTWKPI